MSIFKSFNTFRHFDIGVPDARDFLHREPIVLDQADLHLHFQHSKVLITGAAGSIGSELCLRISAFGPAQLILVDQAETPLNELETRLLTMDPTLALHTIMGDISDGYRMQAILEQYRPQVIFHAAAYKHVTVMEKHPYEAFKTNVLGTKILAEAAIRVGVKKFVFISTDKAVNPAGIMGVSKRLAEICLRGMPQRPGNPTEFVITRFGNVFGSAGSFIPIFKKQIESGGPLTITNPEARRFLITTDEACQLVLEAFVSGRHGDILFLDMGDPVSVEDVARRLLAYYGFSENDIPIRFTGLRTGEKLLEELYKKDDHHHCMRHPKVRLLRDTSDDHEEWEILLSTFSKNADTGLQKLMEDLLGRVGEVARET